MHNSSKVSNVGETERFLRLRRRDFTQEKYEKLPDKCVNLHGDPHPIFSVPTTSQRHRQYNRNLLRTS